MEGGHLGGEVHVLLSAYSDPQGNTTSIEYDENNRITTITDADGASSSFTYVSEMHSGDPYNDPFFKVAVITDPHGKTVSFDYDQYGYLYSITDMYGLTTTFKYGAEYAGYKFSSDWLSSMTTLMEQQHSIMRGSKFRILELEVKDPEGLRKHIKFTAPQNITDPYAGLVPSGVVGDTGWQHYRSTFIGIQPLWRRFLKVVSLPMKKRLFTIGFMLL
jgi:YD repeat-containing protein